jgi:hypothetical protein
MAEIQDEKQDEIVLSISELLDMLAFDPTNQGTRESIEKIISKNYELKPLVRFNKSLKNLEKELSSQESIDTVESARTCALQIIENFGDFNPILTIRDVEIIVNHQIGTAKKLMTINAFKKS